MTLYEIAASFLAVGTDTSTALAATHDPAFVLASYFIAALAGFAFLRFARRIMELRDSPLRAVWLSGGAFTMGLGVWAMHFTAMLAYRLPIAVYFEPIVTAASVVPAILGSAAALHLVTRASISVPRIFLASLWMGGGIGAMHYTGMAAMRFDAVIRYDPALFATSIVVAVVLAFVALGGTLWTMRYRHHRLAPGFEAAGALVMGLAVSGMHYTAMTSTFCLYSPGSMRGFDSADAAVFSAVTITIALFVLLIAIMGIFVDQRLDQEIMRTHRAEERLQQVQKMEALGNLAGGIAHDFNNMLMPIVALSEMSKEDLPPDSPVQENLSTILQAANRAASLVKEILAYSRRSETKSGTVDVSHLVSEAVALLRKVLPSTITVVEEVDRDVGTAAGDRAQLVSAIMNLGSNAADAIGGKVGRLTFRLDRIEIDAALARRCPSLAQGRTCARLTVADTGCGMDHATMLRIFDPFFTTKTVGEGTGLGLSMVHGIIAQHEGAIEVSSDVGKGTTFTIYLPLAEPAVMDAAA